MLAFLAHATSASPEGQIVIGGAPSGTHLRLSVLAGNLVVHGPMEASAPQGCRFTVGHHVALCPLLGNASVQVVTGPGDDKVEVLDRLPVPLIADLGKGSDKLIGNGEADYCYPQGTRRNRCIGGGGNDVCITGPRNTDCVGGPGNDVCRASTGSDGCWGGPGQDVCYMGPGQDGCHGNGGNDRLYGGPDPDQLYGGPGVDLCDGGPGIGRSHECESGRRH